MARSVAFNKLNGLTMAKRLQIAKDPTQGPPILSMLTPSEFADLFPKYYQKVLPDVSGFRLAISQKTAQQQADYAQQLQDRLVGIERDTAESKKSFSQKIKDYFTGGKGGAPRGLTPEQEAAWNAIHKGDLDVTSNEGKMFTKLKKEELSSIGITRTKDSQGRDVFHYAPPTTTPEEATAMLNAGKGGGGLKGMIDRAAAREGIDPKIMYGIVAGESSHKNIYDRRITPQSSKDISFGPFQMNIYDKDMEGSVFQRKTGLSVQDPNSLQEQAYWVAKRIKQMESNPSKIHGVWHGYKGNSDWNTSWGTMGASGGEKPAGEGGGWSKSQIEAQIERANSEKDSYRKAQLYQVAQTMIQESGGGSGGTSTDKWNTVRPLSGSSTGMCARGVHGMAKQIFAGNSFWDNRPGYSSPSGINMASDVAYGRNNIFQQSGMYHPGQRVDRSTLTEDYLNSLPDGTIIAAGGGRSDGAGHIQMKVGGRWVSDFPQSGFLYQRNAQQPYKDFTVLNLTDQGKAQLAQNGLYIPSANEAKQVAQAPTTEQAPTVAVTAEQEEVKVNPLPTEEEFKLEQQQEALKQKTDTTNLSPEDKKKAEELAAKDPSKLSTSDKTILQQSSPPNAIVDKSASISPSATPAPAVAPVNSGPQIGRYKVDPEAFREASKPGAAREGYAGWMVNMATHQDLIDGFNKNKDAIAAGAHISNDWVLTVKNKNDPKVKSILEEYKGNVLTEIQGKQALREDATVTTKLATAVQAINPVQPAVAAELNMNDPEVRKKIEEQHKANIEKQKAQSASLPEGKSSGGATPAKAPETKPSTPAEAAKPVTPTATVNPPAPAKVATAEDIKAMGIMMPKVPGASTGGSFDTGGQPVSFYPMDKRDDIAAINPITQQPLFTAQSGERIQVNPNQRNNNIDQPQNPVMTEINNIYNMMQEGFTQTGSVAQETATQRLPQDRPDDNPGMIASLNKITTMPLPAPLERAMRRTGAGTFDHFGYGNKT
ncbi:hypothetical protein EB001_07195 [bacterium]|nr:hypothetical protein [bacterium]